MDYFGLDDDERVIAETAAAFAEKRIAPNTLEWDEKHHFPVDALREAAELGMAAIYCRDDVGGSELRRLDAVRIFEQLAKACPAIAAFLSIHNMCAWMIDTFGTDQQRKSLVPRLASMEAIASYCRINIAACSLGGAQSAFDKASGYLADRQAFGGSLLDEPTIRFTLADMATALQASRTLLWRAATALDDNHPDKVELCAMAKRYVTDACFDVADQALQLHGGYGYLREYGLEKIVRDLRVHRILEGTNEIMRVVIGRAEAARARAS
jgi:alkylation response protein AidB-like acyl-CoA dehydrogenase